MHDIPALRSWLMKDGKATPELLALTSVEELPRVLHVLHSTQPATIAVPLFDEVMDSLPAYYRRAYQWEPWPPGTSAEIIDSATREPLMRAQIQRDTLLPYENSVLTAYVRGYTPAEVTR